MAHASGMEFFWSTFARGLGGICRYVSKKRLSSYINGFAGRHNVRNADSADMMAAQARNMVDKRLTYDDLIGGPPRSSKTAAGGF